MPDTRTATTFDTRTDRCAVVQEAGLHFWEHGTRDCCRAPAPGALRDWVCTRPAGHTGDHVAAAFEAYVRWHNLTPRDTSSE